MCVSSLYSSRHLPLIVSTKTRLLCLISLRSDRPGCIDGVMAGFGTYSTDLLSPLQCWCGGKGLAVVASGTGEDLELVLFKIDCLNSYCQSVTLE